MRGGTAVRRWVAGLAVLLLLGAGPGPAAANHGWTYNGKLLHWAHAGAEARVRIVDSLTSEYDASLNAAVTKWNESSVLQNAVVAGDAGSGTRSACAYVAGRIHVCNYAYGTGGGWYRTVGLTHLITDANGHILRARVQLNESYLKATSSTYGYLNDPTAWREVLCHELGHAFGLGHQGSSSGSCLRATITPSFVPTPNRHDYDQLRSSYHAGRTDGTATTAAGEATAPAGHDAHPDDTGTATETVRVRDLGHGLTEFTFVRRVPGRPTQ